MAKKQKKTKKPTVEQLKKKYIKANGEICPFCGSEMIDSDEMSCDGDNPTCVKYCSDCHKSWTDTYAVVDIEFHQQPIWRNGQWTTVLEHLGREQE